MRLAIDFGGTNIKLGLLDEEANFLDRRDIPLAQFPKQNEFIPDFLNYLEVFMGNIKPDLIGLATKGGVVLGTAEVTSDIGAGKYLIGVNLRELFETRFRAPFRLDNDARAYALGEYNFGAGRGSKTMLCMTIGTGVGSTLIQNGLPYVTDDPVGGLLGGHISIDRHGIPCSCGNIGCLEGYVSGTALRQLIVSKHSDLMNVTGDPIQAFFKAGSTHPDSPIGASMKQFQTDLAHGLVNLIHAYGPDTIVIGGGVSESAPLFLPGVVALVSRMAWTSPRGITKIRATELGNKAALLGMAFHPNFSNKISKIDQ